VLVVPDFEKRECLALLRDRHHQEIDRLIVAHQTDD
jgi:hypothetical protein